MPVPVTMQDLALLASANSPAGSEAIGTSLDNYLRAHGSITRSMRALASAPIAAASTVNAAAADAESVEITGTATINSLGTGFVGCVRELRFAAICTIVHSNNLVMPFGLSVVTSPGDALTFRCTASSQWKLISNSNSINLSQLNEAIEQALGSDGNYDLTPRHWTFAGDGATTDIPIPGADVPDPLYYYVGMEETPGSGLFGLQRPITDYTIIIDEVDPNNSVMRFATAPGNLAAGDIRLLGYSRPYLGAPTVAAPLRIHVLSDATLTVDGTFHNTLILSTAPVATTITIRTNTGDPSLDWDEGEFFSVCQVGAGKVTLTAAAGATIAPPADFNLESRGVNSTITASLRDEGDGDWLASGDLLRNATTPTKETMRLADRSVLIGTNIAAGNGKDSFIMPYDYQLDSIADRGISGLLEVAQAAGSIFTFDIKIGTAGGTMTSIFQTLPTIDNGEWTTLTANTAAVYSSAFATANRIIPAGSSVRLDVTQLGTALAKGLSATMRGQRAN